jgi:dTMP kinase
VRLLAERLRSAGLDVECVRDPGGTPVSERIRQVLLDPAIGHLEPVTEMFLYMASRAELVARVIRPALDSGRTVVCDRFVSSTVVYQGYAGGLDPAEIVRAGRLACGDTWPELVILLDLPAEQGFDRIEREHDRMELKGPEFHRKVAEGFRALGYSDPQHYVLVDARGSVDDVAAQIWKAVERVIV